VRRRLWLPIVLVAVVAVAATATVLVHRHRQSTTLVAGGEVFAFCWQPPTPADWTEMTRDGMEFGLDYIELAPRTGRVTVTAAELTDPTGGIRLRKVVLAPYPNFTAVGDGERWGVESYAAPYLRGLPAVIEPIARPAGAPSMYKGFTWQLGVSVTVPATSTEASASGLTLHYESGGHQRTYRTQDRIRLVNDPTKHCGSS
jgi:hypothetical protein